MRAALSWTLILMLGGVKCAPSQNGGAEDAAPSNDQDTDLLLTPLIEANKTYQARTKSRVLLFQNFSVEAYSGYITINKTTNSNLFFLLVVDQDNNTDAPLLLWTQGGPGLSALLGQFLQNGPVAFDYTQNNSGLPFSRRSNTLQNNMSIIYLDLPVGAGFSFTDNITAYPTSLEEISFSVIQFFEQFLTLFPQYVCRDLYVAGESYGARYSVAVADALLKQENKTLLKLKGTIGGNGFLGPILDTADSSEFRYQTSMLDESGRKQFSDMFEYMRNLTKIGNYSQVPPLLMNTIFANPRGMNKTLLQTLTSYNDHASPLYTERPFNMLACFQFLNSTEDVRRIFHVGLNRTFQYFNLPFLMALAPDYLRDIRNITQRVLNNSNVLLYTGQLDALFPSVNQRNYYATLNWTYSSEYHSAQRTLWRPPTWNNYMGYAGIVKRVTRFMEAVLLGMSHYGAVEKPDEVYYLMMDFFNYTAGNSSWFSGNNKIGKKVQP